MIQPRSFVWERFSGGSRIPEGHLPECCGSISFRASPGGDFVFDSGDLDDSLCSDGFEDVDALLLDDPSRHVLGSLNMDAASCPVRGYPKETKAWTLYSWRPIMVYLQAAYLAFALHLMNGSPIVPES